LLRYFSITLRKLQDFQSLCLGWSCLIVLLIYQWVQRNPKDNQELILYKNSLSSGVSLLFNDGIYWIDGRFNNSPNRWVASIPTILLNKQTNIRIWAGKLTINSGLMEVRICRDYFLCGEFLLNNMFRGGSRSRHPTISCITALFNMYFPTNSTGTALPCNPCFQKWNFHILMQKDPHFS
jgi:hypothetical protein